MTKNYAARAQALVGVRFRPQGRSGEGLDCVGVVLATYGIPIDSVARDYRLRGDYRLRIEERLKRDFRRVPPSQLRSGDLMLLIPAADQLHLAVRTVAGFVHAHAGIGRVVETPGEPQWPCASIYRRRRH